MKRFIILSVALAAVFAAFANDKKDANFEFGHNRYSFSGLLTSSNTYQLEASYHYMFNRFIGVGGALGFWKVYYEQGHASGKDWTIDSDDNVPESLYLRPSLVLKSPAIKFRSVDIGLYADPGAMLNVPYSSANIRQYTMWPDYDYKHISTNDGQWFAIDLRAGVYLNVGPLGFSAGYMMSNMDVYSRFRHLSYKGVSFSEFYPVMSFMQGAYLTLSYYY